MPVPKQTNVKGAHFMKEDVGLFDAAFFGFTAEVASVSCVSSRNRLSGSAFVLTNIRR